MKKSTHGVAVIAICLAGALAACTTETRPVSSGQTIEERAQARWDHLLAAEYESAWAYYSPGFRAGTPAAQFERLMLARQVNWNGASVREADCGEDRCSITTEVSYRVPGGPTGINQMQVTRDVVETWIRLDGEWWYTQN